MFSTKVWTLCVYTHVCQARQLQIHILHVHFTVSEAELVKGYGQYGHDQQVHYHSLSLPLLHPQAYDVSNNSTNVPTYNKTQIVF